MARSVIIKCRLSPTEFDALNGRLKGAETLSSYIRGRLGINGEGQMPPTANLAPNFAVAKKLPAAGKRACPVSRFCPMRKGRYCTLTHFSPACPLGRDQWELL